MAGEVEFKGKGHALRLGIQQELGGGPLTIFGAAAQKHDLSIREVTAGVLVKLAEEFPNLEFQLRTSLSKREINAKLAGFDPRLGQPRCRTGRPAGDFEARPKSPQCKLWSRQGCR